MSKILVHPNLRLFEPDLEIPKVSNVIGPNNFKQVPSDDFFGTNFRVFPFVLCSEGKLWVDGNLYMLNYLKGFAAPNYRTLEAVAEDLKSFHRWFSGSDVEYLAPSKGALSSPFSKYLRHLADQIRERKLASSTAKRRAGTIHKFYVWLFDANLISYRVKDLKLPSLFRLKSSPESSVTSINDEGIKYPLDFEGQKLLFSTLRELGNPEMYLAFLVAVTTGARMLSVFTLREFQFSKELGQNETHKEIKIGHGQPTDNKQDKRMVLLIPRWLYKKIQVFLKSENWRTRANKLNHSFQDGMRYVFITDRGNPYFVSQTDIEYLKPRRGGSVRQFIRQTLIPRLASKGFRSKFSFHDLRATYGINLVHFLTKEYEFSQIPDQGSIAFLDILNFVRERMGHVDPATTYSYLRYPADKDLLSKINDEYEQLIFGEML